MTTNDISRRRAFATVAGGIAAVGFAGCTGLTGTNNKKFEAAADPWSNIVEDETGREYTYEGTATLSSGEYAFSKYDARGETRFTFQASATAAVDTFVLELNEFNRYRDEKEFSKLEGQNAVGTDEPSFTTTMGAGDFVMVYDNTYRSAADPSDKVEIDYEIVWV